MLSFCVARWKVVLVCTGRHCPARPYIHICAHLFLQFPLCRFYERFTLFYTSLSCSGHNVSLSPSNRLVRIAKQSETGAYETAMRHPFGPSSRLGTMFFPTFSPDSPNPLLDQLLSRVGLKEQHPQDLHALARTIHPPPLPLSPYQPSHQTQQRPSPMSNRPSGTSWRPL